MDLKIKYENGQMTIHMNSFFPTSQARLKKLLNVVALDENKDDHIQTLEQYFKDKVSELAAIIESKKHPNGVKLTKDELTQAMEDHKHFKAVQAGCISEFNRCIKQKQQFLKHLEILEQRK